MQAAKVLNGTDMNNDGEGDFGVCFVSPTGIESQLLFALEYKLLKVYILRAEVSDFLQIRADISEFLRYDVFRSFMDGDCKHCVSV